MTIPRWMTDVLAVTAAISTPVLGWLGWDNLRRRFRNEQSVTLGQQSLDRERLKEERETRLSAEMEGIREEIRKENDARARDLRADITELRGKNEALTKRVTELETQERDFVAQAHRIVALENELESTTLELSVSRAAYNELMATHRETLRKIENERNH